VPDSWHPQTVAGVIPGGIWSYAAAIDPLTAWVACRDFHHEQLALTRNGSSWTAIDAPVPPGTALQLMTAFAAADASNVWVAYGNVIHVSHDGGVSWTPRNTGGAQTIAGMKAVNASTVWAVGDQGAIYKTTDGGTTWVAQTSGTSRPLLGVAALDANTAWAVGRAGTVLKTVDGGASWLAQPSGTPADLVDIAVGDANHVWVRGGVLLRTANGGSSWSVFTVLAGGVTYDVPQLGGVAASGAGTAWYAGAAGLVVKTSDGGASWAVQASGTTQGLGVMSAADSTTAWAAGDQVLLKTP
jgi:photosystem II stability/assembly factor-like uncharacterized protein